jgi:hypothetical protein
VKPVLLTSNRNLIKSTSAKIHLILPGRIASDHNV